MEPLPGRPCWADNRPDNASLSLQTASSMARPSLALSSFSPFLFRRYFCTRLYNILASIYALEHVPIPCRLVHPPYYTPVGEKTNSDTVFFIVKKKVRWRKKYPEKFLCVTGGEIGDAPVHYSHRLEDDWNVLDKQVCPGLGSSVCICGQKNGEGERYSAVLFGWCLQLSLSLSLFLWPFSDYAAFCTYLPIPIDDDGTIGGRAVLSTRNWQVE